MRANFDSIADDDERVKATSGLTISIAPAVPVLLGRTGQWLLNFTLV